MHFEKKVTFCLGKTRVGFIAKTTLNRHNMHIITIDTPNQGHSIERTTHSMEIALEILTMYYATFTCPLSRSSRYCRHFEIR